MLSILLAHCCQLPIIVVDNSLRLSNFYCCIHFSRRGKYSFRSNFFIARNAILLLLRFAFVSRFFPHSVSLLLLLRFFVIFLMEILRRCCFVSCISLCLCLFFDVFRTVQISRRNSWFFRFAFLFVGFLLFLLLFRSHRRHWAHIRILPFWYSHKMKSKQRNARQKCNISI